MSSRRRLLLRHQSPLRSPEPICTRPELGCCAGWRFQRDGSADFELSRLRSEPMAIEARIRCPTFNGPAIPTFCTRCKPLEITQPHWLQSGVPRKCKVPPEWLSQLRSSWTLSRTAILRDFGEVSQTPLRFRDSSTAGIGLLQTGKFAAYAPAFFGTKHLRAVLTHLRTIKADPNAVNFRPRVSECDVFFQIAQAL